MSIFDYKDEDAIGSVFSVDTGTVVLRVENVEALRKLQVSHLVALRSSKAGQHLIGLISKIMRKALAPVLDEDSSEELPEGAVVVENVVRVTLIGTLIDAMGTKHNVFRRTLETVPEIDALCFTLEGTRLTAFMKAISRGGQEGQQVLALGTYTLDEEAEAWLDGNRFFQRHAVIVGSTGCGKSWTLARVLEQAAALPSANAILFDIHGEYAPLAGSGIQHLRIAGPGDLDGRRGLDDGVVFLPYWLLTYEEMLAMILDRSDQNAPNQAMLFSRAVTAAKRLELEREAREDVLANFTIDSPLPYKMQRVLQELHDLDTKREEGARAGTDRAGEFYGKLTRFIQRLEAKVSDRRMGFLFGRDGDVPMGYDWMAQLCTRLMAPTGRQAGGGVKIIDFSEVPSDILPLMIGLVGRVVFSLQQWSKRGERNPIALFCDEAHLYIPEQIADSAIARAGFQSFERIAKEGRKYGLGLVIISQRPAEVNRTVLSQCNNFVAMRLTNAEDQSVVKRLLPDSLGGFADILPVLDTGEALVVGDASLLPSRIRVTPPTIKPASATVDFWDEWSKKDAKEGIEAAVEALRRQSKA